MRLIFLFLFLCISYGVFGWTPDYSKQFHDYSVKQNHPHGIAIIAFNRPEYLKQLIASLEKNPESQQLPFFFFLDGGSNSTQEKNIQLINESSIKNKEIIIRTMNYGCAKNQIDAKRFMFDWCGFEKVIVMEEDVIVSQNYIRTLLNFHDWATKTYSNVRVVQLWSYCYMSPLEKKKSLKAVRETTLFFSLVTYCMDKTLWNTISSFLYEYERLFIDPLLGKEDDNISRSKPNNGIYANDIKKWLSIKMSSIDRRVKKYTYDYKLPFLESKVDLQKTLRDTEYCVDSDWMIANAIWLVGGTRLETLVNRVIHIGKEGITINKESWEAYNFDKIILDEFEEDAQISDFKIHFN